MNTYGHDCNEEESACNNNGISCIDKQHPIPGGAILETGNGSLGTRTLDFTNISTLTLNQRIASTTIDTTHMNKPKVLIDFNGILNLTANSFSVITFNFALTRTCKNNKASQTLTTFTFNFLNVITPLEASRVLKFEYSPVNELWEDRCSYTLELTSIETPQSLIFNFNISNGVISILAIDSKKNSCFSDTNKKDSGNTLLSIKSNISYSRRINFPNANLLITLNQPIAHVYMDTTLMKKPKLLLDFTGILNIVPVNTAAIATLYFTLFKLCKGSKVRTPLTTFAFSYNNTTIFPNSETLKFEYSPCDESCFGCCTYILELTNAFSFVEGTIALSIDNSTLSALAMDCCLNKYNELSKNSIFASNTSSFFVGSASLAPGQLTQNLNLPIVSTTIDISYLNFPKLLIDFVGILHVFSGVSITLIFNFTLYRTCKNSNVLEPLTTFVYNSVNFVGLSKSDTLKFEYCPEDDICGGCFTYILELTSITSSVGTFLYDRSISSAVLSIIAVEP